jgi:hypothetical protein
VRRAAFLRKKLPLLLVLFAITVFLAVSFVAAQSSISASIAAQQNSSNVVLASQGSTIQLVCSFTIVPPATGTGTVYYRFSADGTTFGPDTTITTINSWGGSQTSVDFTLAQSGYYVFFVNVVSGFDSATTHYPASGTFSSNPPSSLPEAPPIILFAMGFVAVGAFVVSLRKTPKLK